MKNKIENIDSKFTKYLTKTLTGITIVYFLWSFFGDGIKLARFALSYVSEFNIFIKLILTITVGSILFMVHLGLSLLPFLFLEKAKKKTKNKKESKKIFLRLLYPIIGYMIVFLLFTLMGYFSYKFGLIK